MSKRMTLPQTGRVQGELLKEMRGFKSADIDWQNGRAPLYVFKATDEAYEAGRAGFFEYFSENALGGRRAFPSVKRMEDEIVEMTLDLALEVTQVPHLSTRERTVGFGGFKAEDLNRLPVLVRPRLTIGLPRRFAIELGYVPPIEIVWVLSMLTVADAAFGSWPFVK